MIMLEGPAFNEEYFLIDEMIKQAGYQPLKRYDGSCGVYRVRGEADKKSRIIKLPFNPLNLNDCRRFCLASQEIESEATALARVDDIEGVSKLLEIVEFELPEDFPLRFHYGSHVCGLVKEYIHGKTLREVSGKITGELNQRLALRTIAQLHEKGIYGIDFKNGGNIILVEEGKPKILDLGGTVIDPFGKMKDDLLKRDVYGLERYFEN